MKRIFERGLYVLLIIGIAAGILNRSTELFAHNYLFGFDQGRDYLAVKNIVVGHKLTLIGSEIGAGVAGFQGIFHGPFYYYSLVIPFLLFKGDPYGGMVLMFLFSAFCIFVSYILGKKLFGKQGGLITACLVALSPPLISQARFIWNSHPSTLFILLSFYFTYLIPKAKLKYLFLSSFFAGFIYNYELAIAIPVSISLFLYVSIVLREKSIKRYTVFLLGFLLSFSPAIFFEIRHNFMGLSYLFSYIFHHKETAVTLLFIEYLAYDHFISFLSHLSYSFPFQKIIPGVVLMFMVFGFSLFYVYKEKNENLKRFIIFLLILPIVNFAVFMFLRNNVYEYYLIDLTLGYILLFTYSFYSSILNKSKGVREILIVVLIFFILLGIPAYIKNFYADYHDYGGTAKIKGKLDAMDYIYNDAKNVSFNLLVFSPPIYTYPYDYILWWQGQKKYQYIPSAEKKGTFYLWIEQDSSKKWSYNGWLETIIKTHHILYTKELPSGFIVQKRKA